jgi:amino acid transporter
MAEQNQLPGILKAIHPRFRTPHLAIIASAACMFVFTISGNFADSLTLTTITHVLTYAATCAALIMLRSNKSVPPTTFKLPFGIAIAVLALALCAWLLSTSSLREAQDTAIAGAVGLLFYAAYRLQQRASARTTKVAQ